MDGPWVRSGCCWRATPSASAGRAVVTERKLRELVAELDWGVQRGMWGRVRADVA